MRLTSCSTIHDYNIQSRNLTMISLARAAMIAGLAFALVSFARPQSAWADEKDGRLDIYFIDVEGGAATLFVTPAGESLLIDSGYPDNSGRDRDRILKVLRDVAGRKHLDHASVSHWHSDHYGNHAALASQISIKNFWDRGSRGIERRPGVFGPHRRLPRS